jgi:5S rRNA maturation endonuclease (ribonuclease M5)
VTSAFDTVVDALEEAGLEGQTVFGQNGWMYQCPAHDDDKASLSVGEGDDGRALVYCFAGCETREVVGALGLVWADLFNGSDRVPVDYYIYADGSGQPLVRVIRYHPKGFSQQRWDDGRWVDGLKPDTERVPYNLFYVLIPGDDPRPTIYIVEGEKDVHTLTSLGYTATTFLGGAGKWRDEYACWFRGRDVVVVADADDPGRAGADKIASHLRKVATNVRVLVPATGKDITDHIRAGLTIEDLVEEGDGLDEFGPLDWEHYAVEHTNWLLEPYVPRSGRVLAFGPAGSLKSLWAMWLGSHVAHDGGRVAYFSLEMPPSMTAQRLKRLDPPKDRFLCFTKDFRLGSPSHTEKLMRGLRDFDLIVIDSWSAARAGMRDSNEQVAELDTDFFLPIIRLTGAAVVVIDNTGHSAITDKGIVRMDHARGASAKGDKMDVTVLFDRPFEDNNYLTRLTVKKMRFDHSWPSPAEVYTPTDTIEFYYAEDGKPMWPGIDILPKPDRTAYDDIAEAGLRDRFKAI